MAADTIFVDEASSWLLCVYFPQSFGALTLRVPRAWLPRRCNSSRTPTFSPTGLTTALRFALVLRLNIEHAALKKASVATPGALYALPDLIARCPLEQVIGAGLHGTAEQKMWASIVNLIARSDLITWRRASFARFPASRTHHLRRTNAPLGHAVVVAALR